MVCSTLTFLHRVHPAFARFESLPSSAYQRCGILSKSLTNTFSESAQQAQRETTELRKIITELLRSNPGFAEHGATYIPTIVGEQIASSSRSISSVHTVSSVTSFAKNSLRIPEFENILGKTRIYRKADRNSSTNSFKTIHSSWSQLSGVTLADVSDLSVICLPVHVSEISNADVYQEGPKTTGIFSGNQLERVRQASGRIRDVVWYRLRAASGVEGVVLLHEAAMKGDVEVVRTVLRSGVVHKDAADGSGLTAIHHSALNGHTPILQLLLDQGANIDAATKGGWTALHYSAWPGNTATVQLLLDRGANINAASKSGETALHYSAQRGNTATAQLFLDRGANVDAANKGGEMALHYSAQRGKTSTVLLLLDRGANIDAATEIGKTALHYSAQRGEAATVQLLLGRGANIDAATKGGKTALHCSAMEGHTDTIQLLLDRGANIDAADKSGETALNCSTEGRHTDAVQLLLARGANIDAAAAGGKTALRYSAGQGHADTVQLLLDRSASTGGVGPAELLSVGLEK